MTLARYPGRVYSRFELINHVQGYDFEGYERTIDAHVKNLRKKIEPDPKNPRYVETVFGRRLWLPEINSPNGPRRQGAERAAINAPMQGTAADLIKLAMIKVQGWLDEAGLNTRLIMQVHDELILEVPEAELPAVRARVADLMAAVAALRVPLLAEVGVGPNWDAAH